MTSTRREWPRFRPPLWLRGGHAQTLWSALPRRVQPTASEELRLRVDADTEIRCRCSWQQDRDAHALVLVHGLTGASDSPYMVGTTKRAYERGMHAIRVDIRNCGATEAWTPTSYQAGLTQDILAVLRELRSRLPASSIHVAAWSLGGNMLMKALGEVGGAARDFATSAIAVCPAFDLSGAADRTDARGIARSYRRYFLRALGDKLRQKRELFPARFDLRELEDTHTMRSFDDRFTAKQWYYRDVDEYYTRASALPWLRHVRVKSTILVARDDPLVPFESFCDPAIEANPALSLIAEEHGGHCAFYGRRHAGDPDRWWVEHRIVDLALEASSSSPPTP